MDMPPPPVFRFSHVVRTMEGEPLCSFIIGYAAAPDQAWDAVCVSEVFLDRWQCQIDDARHALRQAKEKKK